MYHSQNKVRLDKSEAGQVAKKMVSESLENKLDLDNLLNNLTKDSRMFKLISLERQRAERNKVQS